MLRLVPLVALALGLVVAVPSAAQVGAGRIAFTTPDGLYTADADGTGSTLVRAGEGSTLGGWSPDGSRMAFTVYDRASNERMLVVMNADGSDEHVVARGDIALGRSPWSADGSKVAWGPLYNSSGEIFTANVSGGAARQLTSDGLVKYPPEWSPDGSTLVYSARTTDVPGRTELFTIAADGSGAPVQLTPTGSGPDDDYGPAWSPTGDAIAFVRQAQPDRPGIFIINRDGSNLRRVWTDVFLPGGPTWSPDGSRILFSTSINGRPTKYTIGREAYSVDRDGTHALRLTDLGPFMRIDTAIGWSPDGNRILFSRDFGSLWTMNPDGTCEEQLPLPGVASAAWQSVPGGPSLNEQRCHALSADVSLSTERLTRGAVITVWIANDGTEPLADAKFEATVSPDVSIVRVQSPRACAFTARRLVCIADLPRGAGLRLKITLDARRVALDWRSREVALETRYKVGAREQVLPTPSLEGRVRFQARTCKTRTRGGGRIDGTPFPDRICGRAGADLIHPDDGNDAVAAGAGTDVVFARDGRADRVSCGPGRDLVFADRMDKVFRDCERVRRR